MDTAERTIDLVMYGFTYPDLVDGLCRAHSRGVLVRCIFDHTQASGPTEVGMLHRLMMTVPADNIRIGTSPDHRQLIHLKALIVDGLNVAEGSLNWSPSGFEQINDLNITTSAPRADVFTALFEKQWTWLTSTEPQYQPHAA
jgi:phosphatidylserine/phosphatidylglycerophosphate/cardiolipin synthase-like enzyme